MLISFEIGARRYAADLGRGIPLAIPLRFDGPQPQFFGVPAASAEPFAAGGFLGDTRRGGSCNVWSYRFVPHCNGTHTECIGHLVDEAVSISDMLPAVPLPATLVSLAPKDKTIDVTLVQAALLRHPLGGFHRALVLRTLPNDREKLTRVYEGSCPAPYLTAEALGFLVQAGVEHLLVDFPSLDPAEDGGRMAAHRVFWGLPAGSRRLADAKRPGGTVTELIYVPDATQDGYYLLDLQIPAFMTDAAPSRPILYPVG